MLVGLVLNAAVGWCWADPLAGLVIVYYGIKEGGAAWHGEDGTRPWATERLLEWWSLPHGHHNGPPGHA